MRRVMVYRVKIVIFCLLVLVSTYNSTAWCLTFDEVEQLEARTIKGDRLAETELRKAAENGDAKAQNSLGVMHAEGKGLPKNYQEALRWFRKAAELEFALAQYNLSSMYHKGKGVPKNDEESFKWCRKAAERGLTVGSIQPWCYVCKWSRGN